VSWWLTFKWDTENAEGAQRSQRRGSSGLRRNIEERS
jgi:hypothetical protein